MSAIGCIHHGHNFPTLQGGQLAPLSKGAAYALAS